MKQRDDVVAWFNAIGNSRFIELCPEESLRIGLALKAPIISEPAFRILVNERAFEVAGGQPSREPSRTIFGRRGTSFTGTDIAESTLRMIEHASVKMAERYKVALDRLCSRDALDILLVPEWQLINAEYKRIQMMTTTDDTLSPVLVAWENWMSSIRNMFSKAMDTWINCTGNNLPTSLNPVFSHGGKLTPARLSLTVEHLDKARRFTVAEAERSTQSFADIYNSLDRNQRALVPIFWEGLRTINPDVLPEFQKSLINQRMYEMMGLVTEADADGKLQASIKDEIDVILFAPDFQQSLEASIVDRVRVYVDALLTRDTDFTYCLTPHLLLTLDDEEMNFLRSGNEEATFQVEAPETDMGPSGPGPAYHTGHTQASVSGLDFEDLALSDDGVSTVVGSLAAQDGVSTVYNRHRVQARSVEPSVASEQFTEGSNEFFSAEYAVPSDHQIRGRILAQVIQEENEDAVRGTAEDVRGNAVDTVDECYYQFSDDEDYDSDVEQEDIEEEQKEDKNKEDKNKEEKNKEDKNKALNDKENTPKKDQINGSQTEDGQTKDLDDDDFEML